MLLRNFSGIGLFVRLHALAMWLTSTVNIDLKNQIILKVED